MEHNSHTERAKSFSGKKHSLLNEYYSNPSMTENSVDEDRRVQKQVPYSVEWQMYNA
ncbi:MAG: hypothetical protein P1P86_05925 [Bacteroidales bacterium]|nr:hypothetical protein [Bacteroidales bacterium]